MLRCYLLSRSHYSPSINAPLIWRYYRLFRRILRAHRHLAVDLRYMGDGYVKAGALLPLLCLPRCIHIPSAEFRRHKTVTNPVHIIGFLSQWKVYLDSIPAGPDAKNFTGKKLDATVYEKVAVVLSDWEVARWADDGRPFIVDVAGTDRTAVRAHARHKGCLEEPRSQCGVIAAVTRRSFLFVRLYCAYIVV